MRVKAHKIKRAHHKPLDANTVHDSKRNRECQTKISRKRKAKHHIERINTACAKPASTRFNALKRHENTRTDLKCRKIANRVRKRQNALKSSNKNKKRFQNDQNQKKSPDVSRKCPASVPQVSRMCPACVPQVSRKCPGAAFLHF